MSKASKAKKALSWIVLVAFFVTAVSFLIYFFGGFASLFSGSNVSSVAAQVTTWTGGITSIVGIILVILGEVDVTIADKEF